MAETRPVCRVGVDIGGTFTDIVALTESGRAAVVKVASTPDDYGRGVLRGLADALAELDLPAAGVAEIVHGFTVATNAILEGKGAAMALITTEGFRDVLEIARLRTPRLYDLTYRKPPPLVERRLRLEVRERVDARGGVLAPLDAGDVERAVAAVREAGVPSVAVSLLHSYANPSHEQRIGDALRAELPALDVSLSSELLPEAREYERTSTTVINGYIRPVVERYLQRLVAELRRAGIDAPVTVMQSNGGLMPVELAARKPMYCIESGPAAGVIGAAEMGTRLGQADLISFDMGGTTAKASIVEGGQVLLAPEYEVGGGMNAGHRLLRGAGYVLRVPTIDIAEVSAGGGSIAWVDRAGRPADRTPLGRRGTRPGLLRRGRHRTDRLRRGRGAGLPESRAPARRRLPDRCRAGARRGARAVGGAGRPRGDRGGLGRAHPRQREDGRGAARGLQRARTRPAAVRDDRLRWQRSRACGRPGFEPRASVA